ncbi:MAG: hypothetical protein QW607_12275 [Desulfurococcaceae archaeon]
MQNKKFQATNKKQNGDLASNITVYQVMRFNENTQAYKTLSVELSENNKVMLRLTTGISGDKESRQSVVITLTLSELTEIAEICRVLYNHIKLQEISNLLNKREVNMQKQKPITNDSEETYDEEENIKPKKQNGKLIKSKQQYNEYDEEDAEIPVKKKQKFTKTSKIQPEYEDDENIEDEYEDEE